MTARCKGCDRDAVLRWRHLSLCDDCALASTFHRRMPAPPRHCNECDRDAVIRWRDLWLCGDCALDAIEALCGLFDDAERVER